MSLINPSSWMDDVEGAIVTLFDTAGGNTQGASNAAANAASGQSVFSSWLSSTAGEIFSGLSTAIEKVLEDVWDVVLGGLQIVAAVILLLIAFSFAFKNGLLKLAPLAAAAM